jgi:peptide/nickel transport system permease protein
MRRFSSFGYGLARMLGQVAAIVVLIFLLARVVPGDVVDVKAAEGDLSASQQETMRHALGLDRPIAVQFIQWTSHALRGDFGESIRFSRPVSDMLRTAMPVTLVLAGASFAVALLLAVSISVAAVMTANPLLRSLVQLINLWSIALPTFCIGVVGILIFSLWLGWLPVIGGTLMPIIIIGIDGAGQIVKPLYEELREAATSAHVRTARAKGLAPWRITARHLLPTAVPVALALSGLVLAGLIAGTLTMEVLFGLPGLGSLMLNAIHGRDYPVIQAAILVIAVGLVVINALADFLHRMLDPRLAQ